MKKTQKNLTWQDVFKLPLHNPDYCPFMVLTSDSQRAFDFEWPMWDEYDKNDKVSEETQTKIINKLNGENVIIEDFYNFSYNGAGDIYAYSLKTKKKKPIMMIRSWGYLTGTGALNLPNEVAAKLQDDFGKYIVETLNQ